LRFIQVSTVFM